MSSRLPCQTQVLFRQKIAEIIEEPIVTSVSRALSFLLWSGNGFDCCLAAADIITEKALRHSSAATLSFWLGMVKVTQPPNFLQYW